MDRIRTAVEISARRIAATGLLGIATLVAFLAGHPRLAVDATAILLSLEAALLWQFAHLAPRFPFERAPAWLVLPGNEQRCRKVFGLLMAEALRGCARRMAVPVVVAWGAALLLRL
jgi:hypothetical protein